MKIFTREWFKATFIRAIRTIAQNGASLISTALVMGAVNWVQVGSASLLAGFLSVLTALAGLPEVEAGEDFSRTWFKAAGIRALRTVAQTVASNAGTAAALGEVNWVYVGSSALLAGILSVLMSIGGLPEVKKEEV